MLTPCILWREPCHVMLLPLLLTLLHLPASADMDYHATVITEQSLCAIPKNNGEILLVVILLYREQCQPSCTWCLLVSINKDFQRLWTTHINWTVNSQAPWWSVRLPKDPTSTSRSTATRRNAAAPTSLRTSSSRASSTKHIPLLGSAPTSSATARFLTVFLEV